MPRIRNCGHCGKPNLKPVSRELLIFNSAVHYKCDACDNEIDLTPLASIGVVTTVGALAIVFWSVILFHGNSQPGPIALTLLGLAVLALGFITIVPALAHFKNPPVKSDRRLDIPVSQQGNLVAKRLIIWIEKFGFFAGLFAPLLVIIGILAAAALIGFVNFTYFGN
jgi:uncharacterized membrane protein YidH (DUF202 family)